MGFQRLRNTTAATAAEVIAAPTVVAFVDRSGAESTVFGLYYLGSEEIRPWASDIHIACDVAP